MIINNTQNNLLTILFFIAFLFYAPVVVQAQTSLDKGIIKYGGGKDEHGNDVIQTSDGGYAIVGYTVSYGQGQTDIYVVKTKASGEIEWQTVIGGRNFEFGNSIVEVEDGNLIIGASTITWVIGQVAITPYLVKLDKKGNLLWEKSVSAKTFGVIKSACLAQDGNYVFAGVISSYKGQTSQDVLVVKTDPQGNVLWSKAYGGDKNDIAHSVISTDDGNLVVVGATISYDLGGSDIYMLKLDNSGNILWTKIIGAGGDDLGRSVKQTKDKGFIIGGSVETSFYKNEEEGLVRGDDNVLIVKLDKNGNLEWANSVGGDKFDAAYAVVEAHDGGYITAGFSLSFGVTTLTSSFFSYVDTNCFYLSKFDNQGNLEWAKGVVSGVSGSFTNGSGMDAGEMGNFSDLNFIKTKDYGYMGVGGVYLKANGGSDMIIWKFDRQMDICDTFVYGGTEKKVSLQAISKSSFSRDVEVIENNGSVVTSGGGIRIDCQEQLPLSIIKTEEKSIRVFPNPAKDYLIIETVNYLSMPTKLLVYDVFGRTMKVQNEQFPNSLKLNIQDWTPGIYFLQITNEKGEREIHKFTKY